MSPRLLIQNVQCVSVIDHYIITIVTFLESGGIYGQKFVIKTICPGVTSHPPSTQSDNGWIKAISLLCRQSLHQL